MGLLCRNDAEQTKTKKVKRKEEKKTQNLHRIVLWVLWHISAKAKWAPKLKTVMWTKFEKTRSKKMLRYLYLSLVHFGLVRWVDYFEAHFCSDSLVKNSCEKSTFCVPRKSSLLNLPRCFNEVDGMPRRRRRAHIDLDIEQSTLIFTMAVVVLTPW